MLFLFYMGGTSSPIIWEWKCNQLLEALQVLAGNLLGSYLFMYWIYVLPISHLKAIMLKGNVPPFLSSAVVKELKKLILGHMAFNILVPKVIPRQEWTTEF